MSSRFLWFRAGPWGDARYGMQSLGKRHAKPREGRGFPRIQALTAMVATMAGAGGGPIRDVVGQSCDKFVPCPVA